MNPVDYSDLLYSELADYLCPISGELMHDPVLADDGHNYERTCIQAWIRSREDRQVQITSLWTRAPMSNNLRDNAELKSRIATAVHERSFVTGLEGLSSIHQLNAVFAHLDPLRDILAETLDGWRPPQLVVVGQESSGKSSLLERLVVTVTGSRPGAPGRIVACPSHESPDHRTPRGHHDARAGPLTWSLGLAGGLNGRLGPAAVPVARHSDHDD
jgi:hypothetical protein